ncbi:MAG: A/G-specific adenine glycosylase [Flavobacteriales bacterium]
MDFNKGLIEWYRTYRRDLPWRKTREPYRIWLSEVILQQTRVEQGSRYYEAFLHRFPTIQDLADASEEEVLNMWQGLGYYTRARNLHRTARYIAYERNGEFPSEFEELLGLRGIGPYTAAAIASFSFGQRTPVVDGNVERVIARLHGVEEAVNSNKGKRRIQRLASDLMGTADPGVFNQAIMEFGALQCTSKNPACGTCPFQNDCRAFWNGKAEFLPIKRKGKKQRHRYFNYLYLRNEEGTVLEKRTEKDIWQHLYQLPLIESEYPVRERELREQFLPCPPFYGTLPSSLELEAEFRHTLSHQRIHARFWRIPIPEKDWPEGWIQVSEEELAEFALPRLIERFLS